MLLNIHSRQPMTRLIIEVLNTESCEWFGLFAVNTRIDWLPLKCQIAFSYIQNNNSICKCPAEWVAIYRDWPVIIKVMMAKTRMWTYLLPGYWHIYWRLLGCFHIWLECWPWCIRKAFIPILVISKWLSNVMPCTWLLDMFWDFDTSKRLYGFLFCILFISN